MMGKFIRRGLVPGAPFLLRKIISYTTFCTASPGIYDLGGAEAAWIRSDRILTIRLADAPSSRNITTMDLYLRATDDRGLGKIWIHGVATSEVGNVEIITARPADAFNYDPPDTVRKMTQLSTYSGYAWALGTTYKDGNIEVIPNLFDCADAFYLYSVHGKRYSVSDLITAVAFHDQNSDQDIWKYTEINASDEISWDCHGLPIRIANTGTFRFYGPSNPAASTLSYEIVGVYI